MPSLSKNFLMIYISPKISSLDILFHYSLFINTPGVKQYSYGNFQDFSGQKDVNIPH